MPAISLRAGDEIRSLLSAQLSRGDEQQEVEAFLQKKKRRPPASTRSVFGFGFTAGFCAPHDRCSPVRVRLLSTPLSNGLVDRPVHAAGDRASLHLDDGLGATLPLFQLPPALHGLPLVCHCLTSHFWCATV